jgi:hypothetical protein
VKPEFSILRDAKVYELGERGLKIFGDLGGDYIGTGEIGAVS